MKKITIKGEDIARIPLWRTLGKPKDDEEIVLYQLEENESLPVEAGVMVQTADISKKFLDFVIKNYEYDYSEETNQIGWKSKLYGWRNFGYPYTEDELWVKFSSLSV